MRYPACQMGERSDCSACSLSSYGRDCHNNPANQLAYLRTEAHLSQSALAKSSGVNIRQIQRIENGEGKMENVTLKNAIALADALSIQDLRELL